RRLAGGAMSKDGHRCILCRSFNVLAPKNACVSLVFSFLYKIIQKPNDTQRATPLSTSTPSLPQVSANGNMLRSEIMGSIKMRVFLSGMPELRLGLNDKVLGAKHCYTTTSTSVFVCHALKMTAPSPSFELMSYRLNTPVKPLIWIEIEFMIKEKDQFKRRSTANNVEIHIPVPTDADSPKFKTTVGNVKWIPENSEIVWPIKSFPGGKEYLMSAHFGLPSVEAEDKEGKPPISIKFEISYFTTSGIQVRNSLCQ
uniref:MHD domain-containing protein n=1 Tax=Dicentrarchus labrax TaxID=13489 RepID=A0A8C4HCW7_DICLA